MTYTKETWVDGSTNAIDASSLNHLETQYDQAVSDSVTRLYSGGPAGANVIPRGSNGSGTSDFIGSQSAGGRLVWYPQDLGPCTITGFQVNVSVAGDGAAAIKVGIWSDLGGVRPGALLATLGSAAAISTGFKAVTGLSQAWSGGKFWVGAVEQGHTSVCAKVLNDTFLDNIATIQGLSSSFQGIAQDGVSGALPSTPAGENAFTNLRPRIYLTIQ